jgi:hypothetical protein
MRTETINIFVEIMDHFPFTKKNELNNFVFRINNTSGLKIDVLQLVAGVLLRSFYESDGL